MRPPPMNAGGKGPRIVPPRGIVPPQQFSNALHVAMPTAGGFSPFSGIAGLMEEPMAGSMPKAAGVGLEGTFFSKSSAPLPSGGTEPAVGLAGANFSKASALAPAPAASDAAATLASCDSGAAAKESMPAASNNSSGGAGQEGTPAGSAVSDN